MVKYRQSWVSERQQFGFKRGTVCYMDDILMVGQNESQHDERLAAVSVEVGQGGVKLKQKKCEFNKTS